MSDGLCFIGGSCCLFLLVPTLHYLRLLGEFLWLFVLLFCCFMKETQSEMRSHDNLHPALET